MPRKTPDVIRERVADLIAEGFDNRTIARMTGLNHKTVESFRLRTVPPADRLRQTAAAVVRLLGECLGCTCTPTCGTDGNGRTIVITCNRRGDRCA